MLFHPNSFYLLKLAKLSLWYSLDCQVWVWVCRGQSRVTEGNELTAQDRATPKRRQSSQYKWLCLASWVKYGVWMEYHILSVWRHQIWVIHAATCSAPYGAIFGIFGVFGTWRRLWRNVFSAPSFMCKRVFLLCAVSFLRMRTELWRAFCGAVFRAAPSFARRRLSRGAVFRAAPSFCFTFRWSVSVEENFGLLFR